MEESKICLDDKIVNLLSKINLFSSNTVYISNGLLRFSRSSHVYTKYTIHTAQQLVNTRNLKSGLTIEYENK